MAWISDATLTPDWLLSAVICGLGLGIVAAYVWLAYGGTGSPAPGSRLPDDRCGQRTRRQRRNLGAALIVVISGACFLGSNFMDAMRFPMRFMSFWLLVGVLLLWLVALACADMLQTLRAHRAWQQHRRRSLHTRWAAGGDSLPPGSPRHDRNV